MDAIVHSFLMIGQSNMAGRGFIKEVKQIYDENIKMLVNGRWQTMTEPINYDRPTSGIGLAASFAGAWRLKNPQQQIGLIPCAEGGSGLDDWAVDGALFRNAVFQAKAAQRISVIDGILWHQGENDSFSGRSLVYLEKLTAIIKALREELNVPVIPLLAGGLGDFLGGGRYGKYFTEYTLVNRALIDFAAKNAHTYFVSAADLKANADGLHFDALSQRKFGIRYFEAYSSLQNVFAPLAEEDRLVEVIANRRLSKTELSALLEIKFAGGNIPLDEYEYQLALLSD